MSLTADIQQQTITGLVRLYELDARSLGGDIYRFHGHNHPDNDGIIRFRHQDYQPMAVQAVGLEIRSDGKASTPSLIFANKLGEHWGAVHIAALQFNDFVGARLSVYTTLAEYLTTPNPDYHRQIWYIEQKKRANSTQVEFELSNPVDYGQAKIPVRMIGHHCHWAAQGHYRGEECGYTGARFTLDNQPTDDPSLDGCDGLQKSCEIRHGKDKPLPFGGYPAARWL